MKRIAAHLQRRLRHPPDQGWNTQGFWAQNGHKTPYFRGYFWQKGRWKHRGLDRSDLSWAQEVPGSNPGAPTIFSLTDFSHSSSSPQGQTCPDWGQSSAKFRLFLCPPLHFRRVQDFGGSGLCAFARRA